MRSLEKQCIEQAEMIGLRHYISLLINYVDGSKYNLYVMKYMVGLIPLSLPLASLLLYGLSFSHTHTTFALCASLWYFLYLPMSTRMHNRMGY